MAARYKQLRDAIENLSKSADEQHALLEQMLGHLTSEDDATDYGNDELALALDDSFCAHKTMLECGEISREEYAATAKLDALLALYSGAENGGFWERTALWSDPRWAEVRECANQALAVFRKRAARQDFQ